MNHESGFLIFGNLPSTISDSVSPLNPCLRGFSSLYHCRDGDEVPTAADRYSAVLDKRSGIDRQFSLKSRSRGNRHNTWFLLDTWLKFCKLSLKAITVALVIHEFIALYNHCHSTKVLFILLRSFRWDLQRCQGLMCALMSSCVKISGSHVHAP